MAVDMIHTFLKSHCLDIQDLITSHISFFFSGRYERILRIFSGKLCFLYIQMEMNFEMITVICLLISGQSSSLVIQSLYINLAAHNTVLKTLALCKDRTILSDHILSAKYQILRRLTFTGVCVNISTDKSRRLSGNKVSAVTVLANHFIACREVHDQVCSCLCMKNAWR